MSEKINSSRHISLTVSVLSRNVTSDEFLAKRLYGYNNKNRLLTLPDKTNSHACQHQYHRPAYITQQGQMLYDAFALAG